MKKAYIRPNTELILSSLGDLICASPSRDGQRSITGEPANDGVGIIVEDGGNFDHNNGRGQGEGGVGNRAKRTNPWGSWDEEW